jgi:hypothetical protein
LLYARLLGSSWHRAAEPVRLAHGSEETTRAHGCLCIAHGERRAARLLAWLLRLPPAGDAVDTRLVITTRVDGEDWLRIFDGRRLRTRQYEAAADRQLGERVGLLEFRFRLEVSDGALVFRQVDATLMLGSLRVRLPAAWTPEVQAREAPAGARQIRIHVRVMLPAIGPLLTYEGLLHIEDSRA